MIGALLSQDLALDLGSSRTRVHLRGAGCVLDVPSAVAIRTRRSGRREVIAVGDDAKAMLGRTPDGIRAVRPIRAGRIVDPEAADVLLAHLVQSVHGRRTWIRPRILVAAAPDAAEADLRAIRDACEGVGAREVRLLAGPLATATGAGVAGEGNAGHMLVDVGAGTTHVAVICMGEVVVSTTLDVAGDVLDGAIIRMMRREHALTVGAATAERVKLALGAASPGDDRAVVVGGRCLRSGVPRAVEVHAGHVTAALVEPIAAISTAIRRVLEQTPPEVASDVVDHGVILSGGGSLLADLDVALRSGTGLAMLPAEEPEHVVIRGAGLLLERPRAFPRGAPHRTGGLTWLAAEPG